MTKTEVIEHLGLAPHPTEGGYFRRTYESPTPISNAAPARKLLTSIYYLLTDDSPHGYLHKNASDIIHFHHFGSPINYLIISPDGDITEHTLGPNMHQGEQPQLVVSGGDWKISQLCYGEYGLISEAVAPGFDYADNVIATPAMVSQAWPDLLPRIAHYIKP